MMLAHALTYAALGWPVFPCKPGTKNPATPHGFKDATTDPAVITRWFEGTDNNIGLATGPHFWVLDIDPAKGGEESLDALEAKQGRLPNTLTAATRNGGTHLYFRGVPGLKCSASKAGPGLDVRAEGGYVLAPPSYVPPDQPGGTGAYSWENWNPLDGMAPVFAEAPTWLVALTMAGKERTTAPAVPTAAPREATPKQLADLRDALTYLNADNRDAWVRAGMALKSIGPDGFPLWDEFSRRSGKYDADDQLTRWHGFLPTELNFATIFYDARGAGWRGASSMDPSAVFGQGAGTQSAPAGPDGGMVAPSRFRLLSASELAALPPIRWRVRKVLPMDGVAAIGGVSMAGKSFLAVDLGACIASGRGFFGYRVRPAPVVYAVLEGTGGFGGRVAAWQARHGALPDSFRVVVERFDLRKPQELGELVRAIRATGQAGGVLLVDTLAQAAPGMDENASEGMGLAIAGLQYLQTELGGLVVAVHHLGKDASKGLRGHSSLHAALDSVLEVSRDGDRRTWKLAKSKDGEDGKEHPFRLEVVVLGNDEEGEAITSCIIAPEESAANAVRRPLPPKSGNQKVIWDALGDLLRESQHFGKAGAPTVMPCIELEEVIEKTRGRLVCEPKRQTERTRKAIQGLIDRGSLQHREGWIWRP
jgi:hypothetical protein